MASLTAVELHLPMLRADTFIHVPAFVQRLGTRMLVVHLLQFSVGSARLPS